MKSLLVLGLVVTTWPAHGWVRATPTPTPRPRITATPTAGPVYPMPTPVPVFPTVTPTQSPDPAIPGPGPGVAMGVSIFVAGIPRTPPMPGESLQFTGGGYVVVAVRFDGVGEYPFRLVRIR